MFLTTNLHFICYWLAAMKSSSLVVSTFCYHVTGLQFHSRLHIVHSTFHCNKMSQICLKTKHWSSCVRLTIWPVHMLCSTSRPSSRKWSLCYDTHWIVVLQIFIFIYLFSRLSAMLTLCGLPKTCYVFIYKFKHFYLGYFLSNLVSCFLFILFCMGNVKEKVNYDCLVFLSF